ncbi:velvet factor-domain-containing protein [Stachybotrys elegans]|uniref:Velvet factor-domain-containing protein n=1 Tax=Stachybotrys elegans TaxID=80388 RepID=A0A8K0WXD8_9HYPO|nr:velvet factor-domain-containing protein [Stachybotrys elegans]
MPRQEFSNPGWDQERRERDRSCGLGERDRRVIDPPPIVELIIESTRLSDAEVRKYRCFDSYVMSCSILDETGEHDASFMPEEYHRHQRRLMGSLVGTPFVGKDEFGKEGCFFTFADLSCRTSGSYRLKFSVIMIDPRQAGKKKHFPILTEAKSEIFTAYNAKDFPGMARSSELAHSLKAQGCILQLKKGIDRTRSSRAAAGDDSDGGRDYDDDDDDEDDDDGGRGHAKKRRSVRG